MSDDNNITPDPGISGVEQVTEKGKLTLLLGRTAIFGGIGGAIISVLTLWLSYQQTQTMNKQLQAQLNQDRFSRRTEVVSKLYSTPAENPRIRKEALIEFVNMEREAKRQVDLSDAHLEEMTVKGQDLSGILFGRATLFSNQLVNVNMAGSTFQSANLSRLQAIECNLTNLIFFAGEATNTLFEHCDLTRLGIQGGTWGKALFTKCHIDGLTATNVTLNDCFFERSTMTNSVFDACRLKDGLFALTVAPGLKIQGGSAVNVGFHRTDLSRSEFRSVNLARSQFAGCNLTNATFEKVLELETVNWTYSNIHGAKSDDARFPKLALDKGAVDEPNIEKWKADLNKWFPTNPAPPR